METPVLSIITVNFNNNDGLKKTLESLRRQSFREYEHIIIDAGSSDGSRETIVSYSRETAARLAYWVSEPDNGIYDGMNKGIAQARGEYFYFLNSGDCLADDVLKEIPFDGTRYIYGDVLWVRGSKKKEKISPDTLDLRYLLYKSLPHQACFIHRSLLADKGYDARYRIISDWAHSLESIILEGATYRHISRTIVEYDGTGISSNHAATQAERVKWLQDNLNLPRPFYPLLEDIWEYNQSEFRPIIPQMNRTRQFQKRAAKLVKFLFKINSFFSS